MISLVFVDKSTVCNGTVYMAMLGAIIGPILGAIPGMIIGVFYDDFRSDYRNDSRGEIWAIRWRFSRFQ